ncbi:TIGR03862 family flavoprotein [Rhodobacteraceae bacterium NNCM2]|nr:TIGR03862 family flavoprotein [Coraliihabitans acroporae]
MKTDVAIIGAGPAGLAAAEVVTRAGRMVHIFEAKPTAARKFLMAGKSGLNLTKDATGAEVAEVIACPQIDAALAGFTPSDVVAWAERLGEPVFTGSSGRVFPKSMKGSPLLRHWLARLDAGGATLLTRWRWIGWEGEDLLFETPDGARTVAVSATILALGGASWPRLGSDAAWVPVLRERGVEVVPFRPANMGFDVDWSVHFRERFAGAPVKPVSISLSDHHVRGEFVISASGVEGSAVYAISAPLRDALERGPASLTLDLMPDRSVEDIAKRLQRPRGRDSRSNHLRKAIGLTGARAGLLRELAPTAPEEPEALARLIKALPLPIQRPRPLAEAISSAGGLSWSSLDDRLMLTALPGVFAAGEMLDWEAPTGGYLLTGCLATGRFAGQSALNWLA